ncbi:MAG: hypothetical protein K6E30_04675, partial [Lachnospiraceae bacterium]|nr:hypothetical protein [Lachnospiraceae bacterium]
MSSKKKALLAILAVMAVLVNIFFLSYPTGHAEDTVLSFTVTGSKSADIQVYYGTTADFAPENQTTAAYTDAG